MTVIGFSGQIIFADKLLYVSKRYVKFKNHQRKPVDADGKPMARESYTIAFHYDNGETSQIFYDTEEARDEDYKELLSKLGVKLDTYKITI